jgi:hypothetical protein
MTSNFSNADVAAVAQRMTSGALPFPYKTYFYTLDDVKAVFACLQQVKGIARQGRSVRDEARASLGGDQVWWQDICFAPPTEDSYSTINWAADYFTEPIRVRAQFARHPTVLEAYTQPGELQEQIARSALGLGLAKAEAGGDNQRMAFLLREATFYHTRPCAQFRPTTARGVCEHLRARRVYDFCAGWGDRAFGCAAAACVEAYEGRDANPDLAPGYAALTALLGEMVPDKRVTLRAGCPAEEQSLRDLVPNTYDLVFTSPPFFTLERYASSAPATQSTVRFRTFDDWAKLWLARMCVFYATRLLQPGGHLCLYYMDTHPRMRAMPFLLEAMASAGLQYEGAIACFRNHTGKAAGTSHLVPLHIWRRPQQG